MKIETYTYPRSSFLAVEKDLELITSMIMKNTRIQKLLHYTTKDCMDRPDLTQEQIVDLFGKNIKIIPKLRVDGKVLNYLFINFDTFTKNGTNPEFRDNIIEFDIVCHFDQWQLADFQLRPYRIAAEIDSIFDKQHLTGIGELQFITCNHLLLNDEYGGLCLMYQAIHGGEDKKFFPNPADDQQFIEDFDNYYDQ